MPSSTNERYHVIVVGGGAAGFFGAINYAHRHPGAKVLILEKSPNLLSKVRVSGGGRCNVTHACFSVNDLLPNYPRGQKMLSSVFEQFSTQDTINWFQKRKVPLKTESDGRMFPLSNSSQTIIDCFLEEAKKHHITIKVSEAVTSLERVNEGWRVHTASKKTYATDSVLLATGSSEFTWKIIASLPHTIIAPVPSLFTFHINDPRLAGLQGLSVPNAKVTYEDIVTTGPMLITHWGLSGPAILKCSAWAARYLHQVNYQAKITVNFHAPLSASATLRYLLDQHTINGKQKILNHTFAPLPARLWEKLVDFAQIKNVKWAEIGKKQLATLAHTITESQFIITGKSTFKAEFVTAGGVALDEIDPLTMSSLHHPGLYFAGEVLDIDAVTGGFNFQAAWSTGWVAAQSLP